MRDVKSVSLSSWWKQCYLDEGGLKTSDEKNCFTRINKYKELIVVPKHLRPKLIWEVHKEYPYGHYTGLKPLHIVCNNPIFGQT